MPSERDPIVVPRERQWPEAYRPSRASTEAGDTLIELLIAMVIIALAVTGLLGALITAISSSGEHRSLSDEDTLLRSYAETAEYQIQSAPIPLFQNCAVSYNVTFTIPAAYSGFKVGISSIQYWNGSTFASTCDKTGVQLVTLKSTSSGAVQTLSFVVRDPTDDPTE